MSSATQRLLIWGPAIAMMAAIFLASSLPTVPHLPGDPANYTAHFGAYFVLGPLMLRGFAQAHWAHVGASTAVRAWFASALYGMTDELHQRWVPGRYPAVDDWLADATGAAAGVMLIVIASRLRARPRDRDV